MLGAIHTQLRDPGRIINGGAGTQRVLPGGKDVTDGFTPGRRSVNRHAAMLMVAMTAVRLLEGRSSADEVVVVGSPIGPTLFRRSPASSPAALGSLEGA